MTPKIGDKKKSTALKEHRTLNSSNRRLDSLVGFSGRLGDWLEEWSREGNAATWMKLQTNLNTYSLMKFCKGLRRTQTARHK
jgi:hypothetical protein